MSNIRPNKLKRALAERRAQVGCWLGSSDPYTTEIMGGAGFDWLLIDTEHAPHDIGAVLRMAQILAAYPVEVLVRPVDHDPGVIKRLLDIGIQSLVVPWVETAEQARTLVQAMRYPPQGFRGLGSAVARAAHWGQVDNYAHKANGEMCLLVQIETKKGLDNLDEILRVEGVDGIFIGPSDLSASLGHVGNASHPEVQSAIDDALKRARAAGKAPAIFATDPTAAKRYLADGALFVAIGADLVLLSNAAHMLARQFK
ncbi:MAG: HpcH/HpaI aldolase/citrate lyase family protein [Alphaproteobacteria bacterium]